MSKTTDRLDRDRAHIDVEIASMGQHEQQDTDQKVRSQDGED
ncbi:hypothetical protein [Haladaptatus sp. DYF46]|nr:hypothetical protein [Haladaptatus sp. DYF46]